MLIWIFGNVQQNEVHLFEADKSAGFLELEDARVRWFLSVDESTLPENIRATGQRTYRSITIDGKELEFSTGFTDLHTLSYEGILAGDGFGLKDVRSSIETVYSIRNKAPNMKKGELHPFIQ